MFHLESSPVDPSVLASVGEDGTCRVWQLGDKEHQSELVLRGHKDEALVCCFSHNGDLIASGGNDSVLSVWNYGRLTPPPEHSTPPAQGTQGSQGILGKREREEEGCETESCKEEECCETESCKEGKERNCGTAGCKEGEACKEHEVDDADFSSRELGAQVARIQLKGECYGCSFLGDNVIMTAAGSDIQLWDMTVGQAAAETSVGAEGAYVYGGPRNEGGDTWIFETSVGSTGVLAAACSDGIIRLYDALLRSPQPLLKCNAPGSCAATCCSFDAAGTKLACGWGNGWLSVFDLRAGRALLGSAAHSEVVNGCGWWQHVQNGEALLVSTSKDRTVRLWDVELGKQHGEDLQHNDDVLALAVSPLKPYIAIAGGNGGYVTNSQIHVYREGAPETAMCLSCT